MKHTIQQVGVPYDKDDIKMNEDKLKHQTEYTPDKVYSALDRIFDMKGDGTNFLS